VIGGRTSFCLHCVVFYWGSFALALLYLACMHLQCYGRVSLALGMVVGCVVGLSLCTLNSASGHLYMVR
jgi:hypothetical protein